MRRLLVLCLVSLSGCPVPTDLCDSVKCGLGKVCVPADGTCVDEVDAGQDAGTGGGAATGGGAGGGNTVADAGRDCPNACTGDAGVCDRSTGVCVGCLTSANCACPTPACVNAQCVTIESIDAGNMAPVPGEACADATPLTIPHCTLPRTVQFPVDLTGRSDDAHGSCGPPGGAGLGRDLVYALTLDGTYDLDIAVAPTTANVSPVIYLRDINCLSGNELDCKTSVNDAVAMHFKSLTAGIYYLFVDSYDEASAGTLELSITLSSPTLPANETCALASNLTLSGLTTADGGTSNGAVRVDLSTANDDETTSCNAGGPDVVYAFSTSAVVDLVVSASSFINPDGGAPTLGTSPVVELRSPDCARADALICRSGTTTTPISFRQRSVPVGTYFVVLESAGPNAGTVLLDVKAEMPSTPQTNETCAAARTLSLPSDGGTTLRFDVDTSTASDDEVGRCGVALLDDGGTPLPFDGGNPEYVYRLTFPSQRTVSVTAVPDDMYIDPVIYGRASQCEGGPETCVNGGGPGVTENLPATTVPGGDWFLFVESTQSGAGLIHVAVTATP